MLFASQRRKPRGVSTGGLPVLDIMLVQTSVKWEVAGTAVSNLAEDGYGSDVLIAGKGNEDRCPLVGGRGTRL